MAMWYVTAESTGVDFPLSGVANLTQELNKLIRQLFKMLQDQHPTDIQTLRDSSTGPWQTVRLQMEQQCRESSKTRLLRDGFVHAVLLALESQVWSVDILEMFCFCLKQQVLFFCICNLSWNWKQRTAACSLNYNSLTVSVH